MCWCQGRYREPKLLSYLGFTQLSVWNSQRDCVWEGVLSPHRGFSSLCCCRIPPVLWPPLGHVQPNCKFTTHWKQPGVSFWSDSIIIYSSSVRTLLTNVHPIINCIRKNHPQIPRVISRPPVDKGKIPNMFDNQQDSPSQGNANSRLNNSGA